FRRRRRRAWRSRSYRLSSTPKPRWARWLELRLVPAEGAIAGWAWRGCFVLVGLLLVLYREI
ncbi:MAG: hypothetical protein ACREE7_18145, partial [Dongiaceae bacterium]